MSWDDMWIWFVNSPAQTQEDILRQINLKEFLQWLSPKYQLEVLQCAPMPVVQSVADVLSSHARKALKIDTVSSQDVRRLLSRNGLLK